MLFRFIFKRKKDVQKNFLPKLGINDWMALTKEKRLELDFQEKNESMRKKKALLKSIRDEYIKIKNKKS